MNDELTAEEKERLRRVTVVGKVSLGIAAKWAWLFVVVYLLLFPAFAWYLVQRSVRSPGRYSASTRLLYRPSQEGNVPSMGDRQLYRILERKSLKRRAGEGLPLPNGEKGRLAQDLEIRQEAKPSNLYTLTAKSGSREAAVRKVNSYAETLSKEYGTWRVRELNRWGGDVSERRTALRSELTKVEEELTELRAHAGTDTPVEALTSLNTLIGEERRNLLMLDVEIAAAEKTREALEGGDDSVGAALLAHAPELRRLRAGIEELDREIAKLRQVYTDLNPRVSGKLEDRAELERQYREIVMECGGEDPGEGKLQQLEKDQASLLDAATRGDALKDARKALQETLESNEERATRLMEVTPRVALLLTRRLELGRALVELDEQLGSMARMLEHAESELQQIEQATDAGETSPFRNENFVMAAVLAGVATGALALWTVGVGLLFGRVRGAKELAAHGDIRVLGSLPGRWAMKRRLAKEAMEVVANHLVAAPEAKGVVLVCRLNGAKPQPKFVETLDWSLSMAGLRPFILTVVPQEGGGIPQEDTESMLNTVRKGAKGWFPVVNRYSLAPTELQMLRADLTALRTEFDCIFLLMHDGLRRGGDFTAQLLEVCDSALLVAGANRTSRTEMSYAQRLAREAGRPMMGLVTGARKRTVRRELEESRW